MNHFPKQAIFAIVFFLSGICSAQNYQKTSDGVSFTLDGMVTEVIFYNPSTARIFKYQAGQRPEKQSLSVIANPEKTAYKLSVGNSVLTLKTSEITVIINRKDGTVSFQKKNGTILLKEKAGSTEFKDFDDAGNKTHSVAQAFILDTEEPIYGLGIQQQGLMSKRGVELKMVQGNTDDYISFFQSIKGYGLFWDNYSPTLFKDSADGTLFRSDVGECIDYYFMLGGSADGVIAQMRSLTGQAPMFPEWTYGFWQCKERYKSQAELLSVVKKYRELQVPLDGIIQDWQYWGNNYLWNSMEFLNVEFPDPKKMIDEVHAMNAHITISIWSSFGPMTKQYAELDKMGALYDFHTWPQSGSEKWPPRMDYFSGVRVYDAYNPAARDLYWKYLNEGIFSLGMDGWWMDSTEPDHLDFKPTDLDNKTFLGSFRKVRNAYPLVTVGGVYDHQRATTSDKRVFILTRSAFAGQQRYGANTWSGDVTSSWEALRSQISGGLNFSLCGIPYYNSDIGGFFLSRYRDKLDDPEYRELYVRWLQFGTFCPMMRSHGADAPREIWNFGSKGGHYYDAIERYIKLRYRLLPYIYSTSWDVTANQSSMFRALMMDFSQDKTAALTDDEFMFGKSLLVAPVTKSMYTHFKELPAAATPNPHRRAPRPQYDKSEDFSTVKCDSIYLPQGTQWYDFFTGEKIAGGQTIVRETPIDIIPLYIKAGTILPFAPEMQYVGEKSLDTLEIRLYEGANGQFVLYEDEGDNYNYEKGAYSTITFSWDQAKKTLTIGERQGSFEGMITNRLFRIVKVSPKNGLGDSITQTSDADIQYSGQKTTVKL